MRNWNNLETMTAWKWINSTTGLQTQCMSIAREYPIMDMACDAIRDALLEELDESSPFLANIIKDAMQGVDWQSIVHELRSEGCRTTM